jgi:hypothetical protein
LKKLNKNENDQEYVQVLKESLTKILAEDEKEVYPLKNSEELKDKTKAISKYVKMKDKILASARFTGNEFNGRKSLYSQEVVALKKVIGKEYFDRGLIDLERFENDGLKSNAKAAHINFENATEYDFDSDQLNSLLAKSLESAQLVYVIECDMPFGVTSLKVDNILEDLEDESGQYITVEYDPIGIINNADCEINIIINSLEIDTDEDYDTIDFEEEIEVDSTEVTITAEVEIKEITKTSLLEVRIRASGGKNCEVSGTTLSKSYEEKEESYSLSGDERAIPRKYKKDKEIDYRDEDDILLELLEELYSDIRSRIF